MLDQLLRRIGRGGTVHFGELADELGVTVPAVRDMITDLALRGLLKPTDGDCTTKCGGCAFATSCHGDAPVSSWMLTEKGSRAAARVAG